jgi:hypothetical protein
MRGETDAVRYPRSAKCPTLPAMYWGRVKTPELTPFEYVVEAISLFEPSTHQNISPIDGRKPAVKPSQISL